MFASTSWQALRKRDDIVAVELDTLRDRVNELEQTLRGRSFTSWIPGVSKPEEKAHVRTVFPPASPEPTQTATQ